jgi:histidyl-tRNA synthetase
MAPKDIPLKARLPRGFADRSAAEIRATEQMLSRIRRVYERYGFEPGDTPLIEYTDALGKFLPDQDRPNEGVFSFQDDDEQWLSLRYDLTAPLARYVAENYERLPKPYRSYRSGWVFRNEKPGPGRYRQFMQFDADTVGAASVAADAEMCMMAADALEELGFERGQYVIKVNSRKVLDGLRESISTMNLVSDSQWLIVLRSLDKRDRIGVPAVTELLGQGRTDESGDFTKGAGLDDRQIALVEQFLIAAGPHGITPIDPANPLAEDMEVVETSSGMKVWRDNDHTLRLWGNIIGGTVDGSAGLSDLNRLVEICNAAGFGTKRILVDNSVVRGLEYYTGPVFEADLTFEVKDDEGRPIRFGSVGGGGRYDGLVGRFMKENVPATGFSIGVSRLQAALAALGKLDGAEANGPVVVLVMDRERVADYQRMVSQLRSADIPAELYLGDSGMRAQMKYADRRNAPLAIIQGGDEKARGVVQIKDLALGKKLSAAVADNVQWREERPGQEEVREADLIETVNRMLGRGERRP